MTALRRLWSLRRRRPWFVGGSLVVLVFLLAYPAVQWWLQSIGVAGEFAYYDMGAYRSAVDHWRAGESLYVQNEDGGYHGSYLYPPVYVLLFWPLEGFAFERAAELWNALSVALLWLGLQAVVAAYRVRLAWYERLLLLWAIVGFHPVLLSMRLAQTSVFLAGLLSVAFAALVYAERDAGLSEDGGRRTRRLDGRRLGQVCSGVATAVVGTMKLVYAPAGAHLLQDRRRFGAAVGAGLALLAVSVAVFGVDSHLAYLDVLTWGKGWGDSRHPSLWLPPYLRPLYVFGTLGMAVRIAVAAAVALLAVLAADGGVDAETFALGVAAMPFIAPRIYTQDLTAFLPVVVVLLATELGREDGRPLVPVVALWLTAVHAYGLYAVVDVLPDRLPFGGLLLEAAPLLQPGLWGTLLLVGLAGWRVAEAASPPETPALTRNDP